MRRKWIFIVPAAIVGILVFAAIGGVVVQLLWNWLLPPLFGWREISFWQALGLLALCRILFGGFGRHGCYRSRMSDEERARFREGVRRRFGFEPPAASESKAQ